MSKCKFCGQNAGFFKSFHKECELSYILGKVDIRNKISNAITSTVDFSSCENEINNIAHTSFIPDSEISELYSFGFFSAVETFLEDGIISVEEEQKINDFKKHFKLDQDILDKYGSIQKVCKALILRDIFENKTSLTSRIVIEGTLPFLLQKDETLLWVFKNVEFYELQTKTTFEGSSQGLSIKIAQGLYYRTSSFKVTL